MKKTILNLLIGVAITFCSTLYAQGPVIISGLDTEYGFRNWPTGPSASNSHGDLQMWANVIQTGILSNVTANPTGPILVIGGGKSPTDNMTDFWNKVITIGLGRSVTYSNSSTGDISTISFAGYSMIAICNTADGSGKLTSSELSAISARQADIANFVNNGGGLFASACNIAPMYGYINIGTPPLLTSTTSAEWSTSTTEGLAMGLTGPPGIKGPFHNYFSQWPSFLSPLATIIVEGIPGTKVCMLGGRRVTISAETKFCCPGKNLVVNGDFESGNTGFSSQYAYNSSVASNATLPGQYNIVNGGSALSISSGWVVQDPSSCSNSLGKSLVVNGKTCGTGQKVIWEQSFTVSDWGKYEFCAKFKNLKQCNFDIKPKIEVQFSMTGIGNVVETVNVGSGACDWKNITKHVWNWGYGTTLNIKILLDETGCGDGNDIAIDNIALIEVPLMPSIYTEIATQTYTNLGGGFYSKVYTAIPIPAMYKNCGFFWEVVRLDPVTHNEVASSKVSNHSNWWTATYSTATDFPGYVDNGTTTTMTNSTNPGKFSFGSEYKISRSVYCDCWAWNGHYVTTGSFSGSLVTKSGDKEQKVLRTETIIIKKNN